MSKWIGRSMDRKVTLGRLVDDLRFFTITSRRVRSNSMGSFYIINNFDITKAFKDLKIYNSHIMLIFIKIIIHKYRCRIRNYHFLRIIKFSNCLSNEFMADFVREMQKKNSL